MRAGSCPARPSASASSLRRCSPSRRREPGPTLACPRDMNAITEAARTVEVVHETDVLVVGSGPGGFSAALAAARAGARTTLLDRYGCFGGNMTQVGVESIGWGRPQGTGEGKGHRGEVAERHALV